MLGIRSTEVNRNPFPRAFIHKEMPSVILFSTQSKVAQRKPPRVLNLCYEWDLFLSEDCGDRGPLARGGSPVCLIPTWGSFSCVLGVLFPSLHRPCTTTPLLSPNPGARGPRAFSSSARALWSHWSTSSTSAMWCPHQGSPMSSFVRTIPVISGTAPELSVLANVCLRFSHARPSLELLKCTRLQTF